MLKRILALSTTCLVMACNGQGSNTSPVASATPQQHGCLQIQSEVAENNQKVRALLAKGGTKRAPNVVAEGVGVVLFAPEPSLTASEDAAGMESVALNLRQTYLADLAAEQCSGPVVTVTPTA